MSDHPLITIQIPGGDTDPREISQQSRARIRSRDSNQGQKGVLWLPEKSSMMKHVWHQTGKSDFGAGIWKKGCINGYTTSHGYSCRTDQIPQQCLRALLAPTEASPNLNSLTKNEAPEPHQKELWVWAAKPGEGSTLWALTLVNIVICEAAYLVEVQTIAQRSTCNSQVCVCYLVSGKQLWNHWVPWRSLSEKYIFYYFFNVC